MADSKQLPRDIDLAAVGNDVATGMRPEGLRRKYSIGWHRAKQLHDLFSQLASAGIDCALAPREDAEDEVDGVEDPDAEWNISISVRVADIGVILDHSLDRELLAALRQCSTSARMECVAHVLQARIDRQIADAGLIPATPKVLAEADPRPSTSPVHLRGNYAQA